MVLEMPKKNPTRVSSCRVLLFLNATILFLYKAKLNDRAPLTAPHKENCEKANLMPLFKACVKTLS